MKDLYKVYERMHFYLWQNDEIFGLIRKISEYSNLQEFEAGCCLDTSGPFIITLYLLVSLFFNSDKDETIKFLEFLLENEHTREAPQ